ncbi:uncharacterized protein LOC108675058 [Hyalella azteca]|uniref:Follistatin-related protein 1 n=1 Tax=Hyalella azteca TaxID=294128 RepID=A0A8B7NXV0_HYAAZ|nr:uncharacterized protein LOC108675058 [Hyalella azteca]XP_018018530.1 uncharacterized protein LOC108675058 [Hyalella azteca]
MRRQILIFLAVIAVSRAMTLDKNRATDSCDRVVCRAGRECVMSGGESQCVCVTRCPDHYKPVCGSDDRSYDNYCLLHQRACLTGEPISVEHTGYCERDIQLAMKEFGITTTRATTVVTTTPSPHVSTTTEERLSVCYGPQRDAMRNTVISHWQRNIQLQPWHTANMTYRESLEGHFFACDSNRDYALRPSELLDCLSTVPFLPRPEQDLTVTRTLCVDALLELVDSNRDWRLSLQEFMHLLDPLYHPIEKHCSLEGKAYDEGAEVRVECNHCICATGSWVCATHSCPPKDTKPKEKDDSFGYMDTKYDLKNTIDKDEELDDDDDYDEDDDDYDDEEDESPENKESARKSAKKGSDLLNASDKKKLDHLENNIRKFYSDLEKWESPKSKNKTIAGTSTSPNTIHEDSSSMSEESDETSSEEEEDDLLDQYDDLLERSQRIRDRLRAIRTSISNIENHRQLPTTRTTTPYPSRLGLLQSTTTTKPARLDHSGLNSINHSRAPISRKHEKYQQYQEALRRKQDRRRLASQTDNDIWEDQWKAKIQKHHHERLGNAL